MFGIDQGVAGAGLFAVPALPLLVGLSVERMDDVDGYVFTGRGGGRLKGNHVSRRFK